MSELSTLYSEDSKTVTELGCDVPAWIEQDITPSDVAAITEGGCASGAYMPAVTYFDARETMNRHGDDVLEYIDSVLGELPALPKGESWSCIACFYLSYAVELWAGSVSEELARAIEAAAEEAEEA